MRAFMGHTKPNDLADLVSELETIRTLENLREKSPGVFYFKSVPFLHFHDKDGIRWADVKFDGEWKKLEIDFAAGTRTRKTFVKSVVTAHAQLARKKA